MKGLLVDILVPKGCFGDCSNGGISSRCASAILIGEGIPELFEPSKDLPAVNVIHRDIRGEEYLTAYPGEPDLLDRLDYSFGGTFIYSSDSRFRAISPYPISLHDRIE